MQPQPSRFRLTVKGDATTAAQECAARGIILETIIAGHARLPEPYTYCDASAHHATLCSWFAELPAEAPFPYGSLMYFSDLDSEVSR